MMTDIEIAQSVQMKHISEIAKTAGIPEEYLEQYGNYKAKIDLAALKEGGRDGKLILVLLSPPPLPARVRPPRPSALLTVCVVSARIPW